MPITTTIPTNLDFPHRGELERDDFVLAQETAQDLLSGGFTTAVNQFGVELNQTEEDINTKWTEVMNQAVDGGYSQAYIDGNFVNKAINSLTAKTTPIDADLVYVGDSTSTFSLKKLTWANIKSNLNAGFKNLIINGNRQVNQSGLTTIDNAYNYDNHYKVGNNWFMFIDGKNIVSGEPYTLSWDGIATAGYFIGTVGALTINAQTFTAITNGETITPIITSSQILWIKFASDSAGTTYNNVQFETGTVPTPYEQRIYELEENLVQNCYEVGNFWVIGQVPQVGGYIGTTCNYKKNKRISPSLVPGAVTENVNTLTTNLVGTAKGFRAWVTAQANVQAYWSATYIADARPY